MILSVVYVCLFHEGNRALRKVCSGTFDAPGFVGFVVVPDINKSASLHVTNAPKAMESRVLVNRKRRNASQVRCNINDFRFGNLIACV